MSTIAKLRALHEAATAAPWRLCAHWRHDKCPCGDHRGYIWAPDQESVIAQMGCDTDEAGQTHPNVGQDGMRSDARLIAAMRNALPALLRVAEAAQRICNMQRNPGSEAAKALRDALAALDAEGA